jgi:hypothetical protein
LRIYANFETRPQADRACVLVDPSLEQIPTGLPPEFILCHQPPSSAQWQRLIHQYHSLLVCSLRDWQFSPVLTLTLQRSHCPRTRLRHLQCGNLLQAMAICHCVLKSPLALDAALAVCAPNRWQHAQWQPNFWPWRWQLQTAASSRTLSWQQLRQWLYQHPRTAWMQLGSGVVGTFDALDQIHAPQAGRLITLSAATPQIPSAVNRDHPLDAAPIPSRSQATVAPSSH